MSVAALAALRLVEHVNLQERSLLMAGNDHLGNALTVVDHKVFCRQVDEQHANLASVVSVNRSRCVKYRDALFKARPLRGLT